jgi:hypothetical protein
MSELLACEQCGCTTWECDRCANTTTIPASAHEPCGDAVQAAMRAGSWFDRKDLTLHEREIQVAQLFIEFANARAAQPPADEHSYATKEEIFRAGANQAKRRIDAEAALRVCATYLTMLNAGTHAGFNAACQAIEEYFQVDCVRDVADESALTK